MLEIDPFKYFYSIYDTLIWISKFWSLTYLGVFNTIPKLYNLLKPVRCFDTWLTLQKSYWLKEKVFHMIELQCKGCHYFPGWRRSLVLRVKSILLWHKVTSNVTSSKKIFVADYFNGNSHASIIKLIKIHIFFLWIAEFIHFGALLLENLDIYK